MTDQLELIGAKTGNCLRAAIALAEAGLPFSVRNIDLHHGAHLGQAQLSLNPEGKVPTLVVRSENATVMVLSQSIAIMLYASAMAPGRLLPREGDRSEWQAYERLIFFVTDVIAPSFAGAVMNARGFTAASAVLQASAVGALRSAERFVSEAGFMSGGSFTLADAAAFPMVLYVSETLDWTVLPNLRTWFDSTLARPGIRRGMTAFDRT